MGPATNCVSLILARVTDAIGPVLVHRISFLWKGYHLEGKFGGAKFAMIVGYLLVLSHILVVAVAYSLAVFFHESVRSAAGLNRLRQTRTYGCRGLPVLLQCSGSIAPVQHRIFWRALCIEGNAPLFIRVRAVF